MNKEKDYSKSCQDVLALYYYNQHWSTLLFSQRLRITRTWDSIIKECAKPGITEIQFKKKYKLRMKLTPLEEL